MGVGDDGIGGDDVGDVGDAGDVDGDGNVNVTTAVSSVALKLTHVTVVPCIVGVSVSVGVLASESNK